VLCVSSLRSAARHVRVIQRLLVIVYARDSVCARLSGDIFPKLYFLTVCFDLCVRIAAEKVSLQNNKTIRHFI